MLNSVHKKRKFVSARKSRIRAKIGILLLFITLFIIFVENSIDNLPEGLTAEIGKSYIAKTISSVVSENIGAVNYVNLDKDENGRITSIQANSIAMNELKAAVGKELSSKLNKTANVYVPVGNLLNSNFLNGRGFKIPIKLYFEASSSVSFKTEFLSAGLNQSLHRITLVVTAHAVSKSKKYSVEDAYEYTTVLSENIVVGQVPNYFRNVE